MWATRSPIADSGRMTWVAPTLSRMRACLALMAFAHTSSMPSSTTLSTVRTLASMSVPMPTTARSNCSAPIWRNASVSVESAATTWVKSLAYFCTMSARSSTASTSCPSWTSDRATDEPKRPRPITSTGAGFPPDLANDRLLLGKVVPRGATTQDERGRRCNRAHSAHQHQDGDGHLRVDRQLRGQAGAQADGAARRRALERHLVELEVRHGHHVERRTDHQHHR